MSQLPDALLKAAGMIGYITTVLTLYIACAELYIPDASYFALPVGEGIKNIIEEQ
jgi:succinate-acetate transporter protein